VPAWPDVPALLLPPAVAVPDGSEGSEPGAAPDWLPAASWPPEVPVLDVAEGSWPPCVPLCVPDGDDDAVALPPLEEDEDELELEDELLLPDVVDEGELLADPEEPELLLGDVLGTGRLGGLGWVMTLSDRQPDSSNRPHSDAAAATRTA